MIRALRALTSRQFRQYLFFLLIPGLSLKRWLGVGAFGLAFITMGIIFSLDISTGPTFISFLESVTLRNESSYLRGGVFIGVGLLGAGVAGFGLIRSLGRIRQRTRHWPILDSLYVERVLGSGPRITVIGGGSGLPNLLRGLKHYTSNISAVVTVADDGGSSGRLRSELGILPPGDIRNCLVALADSEDVMQQLMDYRFESDGQLDGHSFGNIFIAALAGIRGDFYRGVEVAGELLAIRGRVLPSTPDYVTLVGSTVSGETLIGETRVGNSADRLRSLTLVPANPSAHPDAVRAIEDADMVVMGPGSLFTRIVTNLLISGIADAVANSQAFKVYVCNVAEEPAQTEGYSVRDHLNIVKHYGGETTVDAVIANNNIPDGPTPADLDFIRIDRPWNDDILGGDADVIEEPDQSGPPRHAPVKLANAIPEASRRYRGTPRRLPRVRLDLDSRRKETEQPDGPVGVSTESVDSITSGPPPRSN
ncbi:MAG: YvcK family protein [Chloroflexi bacterium]|nr:YvcK family protein [Chloroflexota bacterium]